MSPNSRPSRASRNVLFLVFLLNAPTWSAAQSPADMPTRGTDFWMGYMQNAYGAQELRLLIASQNGTSGTVNMPLTGWSTPFTVAANSTTLVIVPTTAEHMGSETVSNKGVHIQALDTVTVSAISFQSFTHDGAQVLPVGALGTRYRVEAMRGLPGFSEFYKSELLIVATADNTEIEITPSVLTSGGRPAGVPFTIVLNAGQTYQVQGSVSANDLTGTLVRGAAANGPCRPFAVFGGSMCANVPTSCPACDHLFEQMAPVDTWGTVFHTVPPAPATSYSLRVTSDNNGTSVTIDGAAPVVLNAGQSHMVNGLTAGACVTSTDPISAVQIMEGYNCAGAGDPSLTVLTPADRITHQVTWRAISSSQVLNHRVAVVMNASAMNQLELDGVPVSASLFTTYANCPTQAHAVLTVTAGTHHLYSPAGFIAYAYGMGTGESYAYPLGNNAPPIIPQNNVICSSLPVTLSSPIPLVNAWWDVQSAPGVSIHTGTTYTFTPVGNEVYTVHGELAGSGCPMEFSWPVGVPVDPNIQLSANGQPNAGVCLFEPVQLNATPAPNNNWYQLTWTPADLVSDPQISNPIAHPIQDTWFTLNVSSPFGCGSFTDSILVTVSPSNVYAVRASATDSAICLGENIQLQTRVERVVGASAFDSGPSPFFAAINGGFASNACGSVSGLSLYFNGAAPRMARTVSMNLVNGAIVHFALKIANGAAPCEDADPGENVILEYSTNGGVNWTAMATFLESAYPAFTPISVPIPLLAQTSNTMIRWIQPAFTAVGEDNWAIDNVVITTFNGGGLNFDWTPASGLTNPSAANTLASPAVSNVYTVSVTDPNTGCAWNDDVAVTVAAPFSIALTQDTTNCVPGSPVPLQVTPSSGTGLSYSWTPNNGTLSALNTASPIATPSTTTTYSVTATTDIGCTATDSVEIIVGQLTGLVANVSPTAICSAGLSTLAAVASGTGAFTYDWTPAATLSSPNSPVTNAQPVSSTTYTCTATDPSSGCTRTAMAPVAVYGPYSVTSTPSDTVCTALGMQLNVVHNVPAPASISWTPSTSLNSPSIATPTILVDSSATYTVTVTDSHGCSASSTTVIGVAFDNLLTPMYFSGCQGETLVLDAGFPGSSYDWSTGEVTQQIAVTSSGTYTTTITDYQGCEAILNHIVTINPLPVVSLGPDLALCGVPAQVLDANSPGNSVLWNTTAVTQQITVSTTGTYSVSATSPDGCQASDTIQVAFNALPVDNLQDATVCVTAPPVLDAGNPGSTYVWNGVPGPQSITANASGTYSVLVTTAQNCSATFDAVVNLLPEVFVDLGPDTILCQGQLLTLDAGAGPQYSWNTSEQTQTLDVTTSGTYSVVVTNGACTASDTILVDVVAIPIDPLTDVTQCVDQPIVLNAANPGCTYLWSTNEVTQAITVPVSGNYSVTVTNSNGCSATFSALATYANYPQVDLGPDTALCEGELLLLDAGPDGTVYSWSTGAGTRTIQALSTGTYSVSVGNGFCLSTDQVQVTFHPTPNRFTNDLITTCLDEEPNYVVIDAGNPGSQYSWSTGASTQMVLASSYGWYAVEVTNIHDCSVRDSLLVSEFCPPSIFVPNTFTPNGDGVNDIWIPVGKNIGAIDLLVFDRWGHVLFHSQDPHLGWDGNSAGGPAPNDVYVWKMTYHFVEDQQGGLGKERELHGHVTVLR